MRSITYNFEDMKKLIKMDHQEILGVVQKAVKNWYMAAGKLSDEITDYFSNKPEQVDAKAWEKQLAYFVKVSSEESRNCNFVREFPEQLQDLLVTRITRDFSVKLFAKHLQKKFFSPQNLARIRVNDKGYSYLEWYVFSLQDAILFWRRLEKERNCNPFSQLVPDMERYAAKYLRYHPVIEGFIGAIFKAAKKNGVMDKVEKSIISQEVATLIYWSSQPFPELDVKSVIEFCDTVDFVAYATKFGITPDKQEYLIRSGEKEKIIAYIDEVGEFDSEVYKLICREGRFRWIKEYYEEYSSAPLYI